MESPFFTTFIIIFGCFFSFFAFIVESQQNSGSDIVPAAPPRRLPPPRLRPRPSYSPPPTPSPYSPHHPPPPPRKVLPAAPPKKNGTSERNHNDDDRNPRNAHEKLSPPSKEKKPNFGMKIGLLFAGIAAILQVCVVAFLVIKRRQLLRAESRF